jgi:hypothetical protein
MRRLLTLVLLPSLLAVGIVLMPTSAGATERRVPTVATEVTAGVVTTKTVSLQGGSQSVVAYWRGTPARASRSRSPRTAPTSLRRSTLTVTILVSSGATA